MSLVDDVKIHLKSLSFQTVLLNEITTDIVREIYKYISEHNLFADDASRELLCVGKNNKYILYYDIGRSVFDTASVSHADLTREECVSVRNHGLLLLQKMAGDLSSLGKEDKICYDILFSAMEDRFEKYDGSGFPLNKRGDMISLSGRVLAVSEFLAKHIMNCEKKNVVAEKLKALAGKDFDPAVTDVVFSIFDKIYAAELDVLEISEEEKSFQLACEEIYDTENESVFANMIELEIVDDKVGIITRAAYTPVAEKTNRIFNITKLMIEEVCEKAAMLRFSDSDIVKKFMLPISVGCLTKKAFMQFVKRMIYKYKVNPDMFIFAVTESVLGYGEPVVFETLTECRKAGIKIALDNFGSEFSSLTRLDGFDFDIVKIDRLFVEKVHINSKSCEILKSMLQVANSLDLMVIADGVDSDAQKEKLLSLGCTYMQGIEFGGKGLLKIEMLAEVEAT